MTNYPGGIPVKRYAFIANNRKEIEVNYRRVHLLLIRIFFISWLFYLKKKLKLFKKKKKQLNVILLTNKHMRDIDGFLKTSFERTGQLQVSNRVKY